MKLLDVKKVRTDYRVSKNQQFNEPCLNNYFFSHDATVPVGCTHCPGPTITLRHTTLGRTLLDERSARPRDLYLSTYNIHKRQITVTPEGYAPAIPESERPQSHTLDGAATATGFVRIIIVVVSIIIIIIIIIILLKLIFD
jgi:hypothetical protein